MATYAITSAGTTINFGEPVEVRNTGSVSWYWRDATRGTQAAFRGDADSLRLIARGPVCPGETASLPRIAQIVAPTGGRSGEMTEPAGTESQVAAQQEPGPPSPLSPTYSGADATRDDSGVAYSAGVERRETIAIAEPQTVTTADDEGEGGNPISVMTEHDGTLWGIEDTTKQLHKSTDGTTWDATGLDTSSLYRVWADPATGYLFAKGVTVDVQRSTDGGATFATVIHENGAGETPEFSTSDVDWPHFLDMVRFGDYLYFAEYGTSGGGTTETEIGNIIWRSGDDGATWTACFDQREVDWCSFRHIHTLWTHEATGRIGFVAGDSYNRITGYSDDYGQSWHALTTRYDTWAQPIAALDVGDSRRILVGADSAMQLGTLDVLTGEYQSVYQGLSRVSTQTQYVARLFQDSQGTIYACQWTAYDAGGDDARPHILVADSIDGPWAAVHAFAATNGGVRWLVELDGTLHGGTLLDGGTEEHVSWPLTTVESRKAVLLDAGADNQFAESMADGTETDTVWGASASTTNPTVTGNQDAPGLTGRKCFLVQNSGENDWADADSNCRVYILGAGRASGLTVGNDYQVSALMRSDGPVSLDIKNLKDGSAVTGATIHVFLDTTWRRVELPVTTIGAGEDERGLIMYIPDGPVVRPIYITDLQCNAAPSPTWHTGGAGARDDAAIESPVWMPSGGWTHVFAVRPLTSGGALRTTSTGAKLYLGRWYGSDAANDYAELYWEPSSADSLDLVLAATTDDGENTYTAQTTTTWEPQYGGSILVAVKFDASTSKFTLSAGLPTEGEDGWESATAGTATAGFAGVQGRVAHGGSDCLPGWYADLGFVGGVLADADLWNWVTTSS